MRHSLGIKESMKKNSMLLVLIATMILFNGLISASGRGSLFVPANISNLISQNSYVVILATGMLLCILTGGNIDLSVGSVVALVGALAGTLIVNLGWNIYFSIFVCLLTGLAIGAWQGFWIAYVRIPPFITTLAGMLLWRGVALLILNGLTISPFPEEYLNYFNSFLPNTDDKAKVFAITFIISVIICLIVIAYTLFNRQTKKKKGYQIEPLVFTIARIIFLSAAILLVASLLGQHKG
ncbi:MAG: sugar ABC transporter permease, partial [Sphaerochaeta sp.]|nr:sugar ABC transporter permease [Sphaerochaeta sp.]